MAKITSYFSNSSSGRDVESLSKRSRIEGDGDKRPTVEGAIDGDSLPKSEGMINPRISAVWSTTKQIAPFSCTPVNKKYIPKLMLYTLPLVS